MVQNNDSDDILYTLTQIFINPDCILYRPGSRRVCADSVSLAGDSLGGVTAMIELNNLVVGYQGKGLTEPVSGCFDQGSLTAIMGENGTGKSTLLKTICGMLSPVSGHVSFRQNTQTDMSWLPQQADIDRSFPINVFDVVSMGCWPRRSMMAALRRQDIARVEAALETTGISDLANYSVNQLSGGQFQRMLFARLLVQDAPVMLMDEPFTGIDAQTQEMLIALIGQLHQAGKTIIAVLHNPEMVHTFFPQTLVINHRCFHWGETGDVLSRCGLFQPQAGLSLRFG
ncbi:High-affinity zinc uptake system ATP-binding protein ZnuC [Vibrio aerogenes CECT 7868]|uniref:High-affinity zinc uptake system ATP-binding protein ZnuC n=1 Tax=Vibrio aerogenes CECT 7868 TaxID=1216006 RepID=A0A1M5XE87_9VIBR|nr:High-affinity zinc uptake system ATP-binding protein ZnuC [Vibrio aerogenes CECT 7868]